jgi:hypothetical protein
MKLKQKLHTLNIGGLVSLTVTGGLLITNFPRIAQATLLTGTILLFIEAAWIGFALIEGQLKVKEEGNKERK